MIRFFKAILLMLILPFIVEGNNPLVKHLYTADPTARVMNGKLYVFPSCDIKCAEGEGNNGFCMPFYHAFSSENMFDWTDHGRIIDQNDVPWGKKNSYGMWAPDCIEKDGKYYYYFPGMPEDSSAFRRIGVAIAKSPEGPYKLEKDYMKGVSGIDPNVFIDDDGQAYLYYGGGEKLQVVKLKDDMKTIDGEVKTIMGLPAKYKEGPFMFKRNGVYYFTFPHSPSGSEELAYAIGTSPMGPFEYKGLFMQRWTDHCWTNHHSVVEYKGQWIVFYHHHDISKDEHLRSMCADYLNFNADGTIQEVIPSLRGIGICPASNKIQVDRYTDIHKAQANLMSDQEEPNWQVDYIENGGWVKYDRVDFSKKKYTKVTARVACDAQGGVLEIRQGGHWGKLIASIPVKSTEAWNNWTEVEAELQTSMQGVQNITCVFKGDKGYLYNLDWIQFR